MKIQYVTYSTLSINIIFMLTIVELLLDNRSLL